MKTVVALPPRLYCEGKQQEVLTEMSAVSTRDPATIDVVVGEAVSPSEAADLSSRGHSIVIGEAVASPACNVQVSSNRPAEATAPTPMEIERTGEL